MDSVPLPNSFPGSFVNWATSGSNARFFGDAGLGSAIFCFEPLAVAAGTEAVLRDGSLGDITAATLEGHLDRTEQNRSRSALPEGGG